MKRLLLSALLLPLVACASSSVTGGAARATVVDADPTVRAPLMAAVAALEGRWEMLDAEGAQTEFVVSSNGSVVRERMLVGLPMEMTNMYTLDGNVLRLTHYCAAGNQPHMRATRIADDRIEFEPDGVSDLKSKGEVYMGQMTLVFVDDDNVEQHWKAFGDEPHDTLIRLKRIR